MDSWLLWLFEGDLIAVQLGGFYNRHFRWAEFCVCLVASGALVWSAVKAQMPGAIPGVLRRMSLRSGANTAVDVPDPQTAFEKAKRFLLLLGGFLTDSHAWFFGSLVFCTVFAVYLILKTAAAAFGRTLARLLLGGRATSGAAGGGFPMASKSGEAHVAYEETAQLTEPWSGSAQGMEKRNGDLAAGVQDLLAGAYIFCSLGFFGLALGVHYLQMAKPWIISKQRIPGTNQAKKASYEVGPLIRSW